MATNRDFKVKSGLILGEGSPLYWGAANSVWVAANNGTGALGLYTGATERIRIDSAGNVGLGIASPSVRLDVNGSAQLRGGGTFLLLNGDNSNYFFLQNAGATGAANAYLAITQGGVAERLRIDSSGNLLINTTSGSRAAKILISAPSVTLASTTTNFYIRSSDTQAIDKGGSMAFGGYNDNAGTSEAPFGYIAGRKENGTTGDFAGYLQFGVTTAGAATNEVMRITSGGNVLIGASSQITASKLYVAGARSTSSGEFLGGIQVADTTTGGAAGVGGTLAFSADSQGAGVKQYAAIAGSKENGTVTDLAGYLAFYSRPAGGNLTERMRIDSAGNVGVGTTTPSSFGKFVVVNTTGRFVSLPASGAVNIATFRYDDNNPVNINLVNLGMTAAGHGVGTIYQLGSDNVTAINAGRIDVLAEQAWTATAATQDSYMRFATAQDGTLAERMRITSGGDVGIGQSPVAYGSGYVNLALGTATGGGIFDSYYAGTRAISMFSTVAEGRLDTFGASRPLNIYVNNIASMTIDTTGNVGIGSAPSFKLDVQKSQNAATVIRAYNGNTGSSAASVLVTQSDAATMNLYSNSSTNVAGGTAAVSGLQVTTNTPLAFWTNNTERMRINSAGDVGIGTAAPGYKLDVLSTSQNNPVVRIIKANSGTANEHGGALIIANQGPANIARAAGTYGGRIEFQYSQPTSQAMQVGASIYSAADGTQSGTGTAAFLGFCTSDATGGGANNERMRITSAGDVVIGGSSAQRKLQVVGDAGIGMLPTDTSGITTIGAVNTGLTTIDCYHGTLPAAFCIRINTTGGSGTSEKLRVDANGNLLIGTTSVTPGGSLTCTVIAGVGNGSIAQYHATGMSSGSVFQNYIYGGTVIGTITQNGTTSVSFNTTSDARLKKDIVDAPSAIEKVKALQVRSFNWKADESHVEHGFIAQELNTVEPLAVTEGEVWAIDPSKLVATLTKALQEALSEIDSLKARVAALEI